MKKNSLYTIKSIFHSSVRYLLENTYQNSPFIGNCIMDQYACFLKKIVKKKPDIFVTKIISDKYHFIYTGIPKVASSTFRDFLYRYPETEAKLDTFITTTSLEKLIYTHPKFNSYFKYTFVRNPWSRVVSCYRDKILNAHPQHKVHIIKQYEGLYPNMPFSDFVDWLCASEGKDDNADRHWISQYKLISDSKGKLLCDFIGKYENLEKDTAKIMEKLQLPYSNLPKTNAKPTEKSYQKYYNLRTKKLIEKRYKIDIELFGYDF